MNIPKAFTNLIESLCRLNRHVPVRSVFFCNAPPPISLHDYAVRLFEFMYAEESTFIVAGLYLAKLFQLQPALFTHQSCHKLMISTCVVAAKFTDDVFYTNAYYAEVGGVRTSDICSLEKEVVKMLQWDLYVTPEMFSAAVATLSNPIIQAPQIPSRLHTKFQATWDGSDTEEWQFSQSHSLSFMDETPVHEPRPSLLTSSYTVYRDISSESRPTKRQRIGEDGCEDLSLSSTNISIGPVFPATPQLRCQKNPAPSSSLSGLSLF